MFGLGGLGGSRGLGDPGPQDFSGTLIPCCFFFSFLFFFQNNLSIWSVIGTFFTLLPPSHSRFVSLVSLSQWASLEILL